MFNNKYQYIFAVAGMLVLSNAALAASCDFLPKEPQPDWVSAPTEVPGFYTGIGLSEQGNLKAHEQIKVAKQNALQDLASSIKVSVKDKLLVKEALRSSGGSSSSEKDVESVTETVTNQSLEQVKVDKVWLDQDKCIVWTRVKVKKELVEQAQTRAYETQKLDALNALVATAENSALPVNDRTDALKLAKLQIGDIDFSAVESALSKDAMALKLQQLDKQLKSVTRKKGKTKQLWDKVAKLEQDISGNSSPSEKEDLTNKAIDLLRQVIYTTPMEPGIAEAERAYFKIADLEKRRNNPCSVRIQYEIVVKRSPSPKWQQQAKQYLSQYACDDKQRKIFDWRVLLEGRNVDVRCAFKTNGKAEIWKRACSDVITHIKQFGANIISHKKISPKKVLQTAEKARNNSYRSPHGQVVTIFITATGDIHTRKNPRNPRGGKDYQYSGDIATYLVVNNRLEATDTFNGVGGWNPISQQMAMDVLAINVVKRWKKRTLRFIHKGS